MASELIGLFDTALDFDVDTIRNIRTLRRPQDLFDDLSDNRDDWAYGQHLEMETNVPHSGPVATHRPFDYQEAIAYVFEPAHWQASRFSDGRFAVWYGALDLETSIHETVYHWIRFLRASGFDRHSEEVTGERRVYLVQCTAILLDVRGKVESHPELRHPHDCRFTQAVGCRLHHEGHPGLIYQSARCEGDCLAVFQRAVLSHPRSHEYLIYRLSPGASAVSVDSDSSRKKIGLTALGLA